MSYTTVSYKCEREPQKDLKATVKEIINALIDDLFATHEWAKEQEKGYIAEHEECENARLEAEELRGKYEKDKKFYWED